MLFAVLGLLLVTYGLSYAIMHRLGRLSARSYTAFRLVLLPGIVIHELSHAFACVITGTPIVGISFWNETGGSVTHHKPSLPLIAQPLISFAPFVVGILALLGISRTLPEVAWYWAILLVLLMVSIAATLAPSKVDLLHAAEGAGLLIILIGTLYYFYPHFFDGFRDPLINLARQLLFLDGILLFMWASFWLLHAGFRPRRR